MGERVQGGTRAAGRHRLPSIKLTAGRGYDSPILVTDASALGSALREHAPRASVKEERIVSIDEKLIERESARRRVRDAR
jgi:hypothetical protein